MAIIYGQDQNSKTPAKGTGPCTDVLLSNLLGGQAIVVVETVLTVDDLANYPLPLPPITDFQVVGAFIQVENPTATPAAPTADDTRVIKYTVADGGDPSDPAQGLYMAQFGAFEINGGVNLTNFRARGFQAGQSVNLRIQFYK